VLAAAQVAGHIDHAGRTRLGGRGGSTTCCRTRAASERAGTTRRCLTPPSLRSWPRLSGIDTAASRALQFTVLTVARSGETLGMTWDEVDFDAATWVVPASRMKMKKEHAVPLSEQAVAILRAQEAERDGNPFVFAVWPQRPLSGMAMSVLLRRMNVDATVHGMRSSARSWMADNAVPFELAEACLAHAVGNAVVQAYQRSSILERRRPIMSAWAAFVTGQADDNVVELRRAGA
jgi:integrase